MRRPPVTLPLRLYRAGLRIGEPAVAGLLAWRARRGKEDLRRLGERRGLPGRARPVGPLVWMHGASVGEVLSLVALVEGMIARGYSVLVTTGTRTAADLIGARLPPAPCTSTCPSTRPGGSSASWSTGSRTSRSSPSRRSGRTPSSPCTSGTSPSSS